LISQSGTNSNNGYQKEYGGKGYCGEYGGKGFGGNNQNIKYKSG
jgi:hypothetical protein